MSQTHTTILRMLFTMYFRCLKQNPGLLDGVQTHNSYLRHATIMHSTHQVVMCVRCFAGSKTFPVVLSGVAKFAHLISVDFTADLMKSLEVCRIVLRITCNARLTGLSRW